MPYVILINDDNTLYASYKERIMQKSKLFDSLIFLASPEYKGYDMSKCTVVMEYVLPVSKKYKTEILTLSKDGYKGYLKYILPIDTELTSEAGKIELQLTFAYADLMPDGTPVQRVRKTSAMTIDIIPVSAWSDLIPDDALSAIDQRIIKVDAQIKSLDDRAEMFDMTKADNLTYDMKKNTLSLLANGEKIGDEVFIEAGEGGDLENGVPIVDFSDVNVVEF